MKDTISSVKESQYGVNLCDVKAAIRLAGYDQFDCGGSVDFGDACRIASESDERVAGYMSVWSAVELAEAEQNFNDEFQVEVDPDQLISVGLSEKIEVGSKTFWDDIVIRYGSKTLFEEHFQLFSEEK